MVVFLLVASRSAAPPPSPPDASSEEPRASRADAAPRLLIVDDEHDLRRLLGELLADSGWQVVEAEDGEQALAHLARERFDVVLLDHRMPGLSGGDVFRRLRAAGDETPVILMTAARDVRELARSLGVPRFLGKPFDLDELLAAVRELALPPPETH